MSPRDRIIEILSLLASKEEQLEYERNVPIANVPSELVCLWFDDLGECWRSCHLAPKERDRIEAFNDFYEIRVRQLPNTLREMHESNVWNEIVEEAQSVLSDLDWQGPSAQEAV